MANTVDTIGDQATLDGIISHSLTDFEADNIFTVRAYACYHNHTIKNITLPNVTQIGNYAFENCYALEKFDSSAKFAFNTYGAFSYCCNLTAVILRSPTKIPQTGMNYSFDYTPIANNLGCVYVPDELVDTYKNDSAWGKLDIQPISAYPKTSFGTITDTWAEIKAAENDGSYLTKYSIGDTKNVMLNRTPYMAQIIGFDLDSAADGSDDAHITWMLTSLVVPWYYYMIRSNETVVGWASSFLRTNMINNWLPNLDCKDYIVPVTKTYLYGGTTQTCTDSIWIPAAREMSGESGYESSGCVYTNVFSDATSKIMRHMSSNDPYWLRSAPNTNRYYYVSSSGTITMVSSMPQALAVIFGFCT